MVVCILNIQNKAYIHIYTLYLHKESFPHSIALFLIGDGRDGDVQPTNSSRSQLHAERLTAAGLYHQLVVVREGALQ